MKLDAVFTNANIVTMDGNMPVANAIGIASGRILFVGSDNDAASLVGTDSRVVNLNGLTVVPGFNDSHMHILPYGIYLGQADLSPIAGIRDSVSLVTALRKWADANPDSEWALGNRYDQNCFPDAKHPTRHDLDRLFLDQPAYIVHTSAHAAVANSVALKMAGITLSTKDPRGGSIVRDEHGEPTGVLLENAAMLLNNVLPKPGLSQMVKAIHRASVALASVGVTSASDMHTGWFDVEMEVQAYKIAADEGVQIRATLFPGCTCLGSPEKLPTMSQFLAEHNNIFIKSKSPRLGAVKLFADGALTTRTAALREPYVDGSGVGILLHQDEELRAYVEAAHQGGWQIATHAIGDIAVDSTLQCYAKSAGPSGCRERRHRIEHAMLLDGELIERMRELSVIPAMQPEFLAKIGDAYRMGLGDRRASNISPYASLMAQGLGIAFGSDCPVVPGDPLDGIRAAYHRTSPTGFVLGSHESMLPETALACYTANAAYSVFDENESGMLQPGLLANMAILSHDPSIENLDQVRLLATVSNGMVVYASPTMPVEL